jgi:hypothetical protein
MVHFITLNSFPRFLTLNSTHWDQPDSEHLKAMDTPFSTENPDLIIDKGFVQDELDKFSERNEHRARLEAVRFGFSVRPEFKKRNLPRALEVGSCPSSLVQRPSSEAILRGYRRKPSALCQGYADVAPHEQYIPRRRHGAVPLRAS